MISQEFSQLLSVVRIFVDTQLKVLTELFVEFLIIFSIFADLLEEFQTFFSNVLSNDFQDFVVLQILS